MPLKIDVDKALSDCRRFIVEQFFLYALNREPSRDELDYCVRSEDPLEITCMGIVVANLSTALAVEDRLPITLAMFVKDAEDSIHLPIRSVGHLVREIVVVDTGSTDNTVKIAESLGARVYSIPFTDFGSIRTITAHLARQPFVLMLDSDEVLDVGDGNALRSLIADPDVDAWGLPRRRWADLEMRQQEETEAYPDWQFRLFRNKPYIRYKNRVHEALFGARRTKTAPAGPHIEHMQSVFKKGDTLKQRNHLYERLYALDVAGGVIRDVPAVAGLDKTNDK